MLDFDVVSNIEDILGALDEFEAQQLPFAYSNTVNRMAFEGMYEVRRQMPDRFTLRRPWVQKGVRVEKGTKRNPEAGVYTKQWYMEDQEAGARRRPRHGNRLFRPALAIRRGGVISGLPTKRPKTLLKQIRAANVRQRNAKSTGRRARSRKNPTPFVQRMRSGKVGIFVRRGERRYPIVLLYAMERFVEIEPRWEFAETMHRMTDKQIRGIFAQELQKALATSKKGPKRSAFVDYVAEHPDGLLAQPGNFAATQSMRNQLKR